MVKRRVSKKDNGVCPMDIDWVPTVVMKKKKKAYIPKAVKIQVWANAYGLHTGQTMCPVCKFHTITQMNFHCGHIVAEAEGGETVVSNLYPICAKCNLSMGKKNMIEFHKTYFK